MPPVEWWVFISMARAVFLSIVSYVTLTLGVVSAPLWNSEQSCFAGMFTVSDIIHLIQYYWQFSSYDNASQDVETFRLESLRGMASFTSSSFCGTSRVGNTRY